AVVGLRLQKERLAQDFVFGDYSSVTISLNDVQTMAKGHLLVLHPGPVGWGAEFDLSLQNYGKNLILRQVQIGVWLRMYLFEQLWGKGAFF
ncbi:MAG: hypothetical protein NZ480_00500, partial [Bdellovibrionaceae bacterium]|nr:hypothetical protein [Pseudobdellovibrionaceae bacterium]